MCDTFSQYFYKKCYFSPRLYQSACPFGDYHCVTASNDHSQKVVKSSHVLGILDSTWQWFREMHLLRKLESKGFLLFLFQGHGDVVLKVHNDIAVKLSRSLTFLYTKQSSEKRGICERAWAETSGLQR